MKNSNNLIDHHLGPFLLSTSVVSAGGPFVPFGVKPGGLVSVSLPLLTFSLEVVLLLSSPVFAVVLPLWLDTVVFSSLGVVPAEEGRSVGSRVLFSVTVVSLVVAVVSFPVGVVSFPAAEVLFPLEVELLPLEVELLPLPVPVAALDLGCKLLRSSHPAAPPLIMFGR